MVQRVINRRLGARVRQLRRGRGWSQEELGERIGRSVDTISNVERGASSTRIDTAAQIARVLGISLSELFEFEPRPPISYDPARIELLEVLSAQPTEIVESATAMARVMIRLRVEPSSANIGTPARRAPRRR